MKKFNILFLFIFSLFFSRTSYGQENRQWDVEIEILTLEELMALTVTTASGIEESLLDAPATMIIITSEDIKQRGYSSLYEILQDLPGFDIIIPNGTSFATAYQRGYRTPWTQRTLVMFNGIVDNNLWTHDASLSRQYPISNVKRVEVLYGPASAVYGPNAFLGIINVLTNDATDLGNGVLKTFVNYQIGSNKSRNLDLSINSKLNDISISLSGRIFRSDEEDLSGKWGFLSNKWEGNKKVWGPILDLDYYDKGFGKYYDPTDDYGLIGTINFNDMTFGIIHSMKREGYGAEFATDRAQVNSFWNNLSTQIYMQIEKKLDEKLKLNSLLLYRESRVGGDWTEATPDWDDTVIKNDTLNNGEVIENWKDYSYISFTKWNSDNNSWLFKQNVEYSLDKNIILSAGIKYEKKNLTKAYDIPGYWNAYSSTIPSDQPGPYGYGAGIGHSSDAKYIIPQGPDNNVPSDNRVITEDIGGFVQSIFNLDKIRLSFGLRYDNNSIYGDSWNPRISTVYNLSKKGALKLIYGEAFQEPAPVQLYGGWSGRLSNPQLKPEKAKNLEFIAMYI